MVLCIIWVANSAGVVFSIGLVLGLLLRPTAEPVARGGYSDAVV